MYWVLWITTWKQRRSGWQDEDDSEFDEVDGRRRGAHAWENGGIDVRWMNDPRTAARAAR